MAISTCRGCGQLERVSQERALLKSDGHEYAALLIGIYPTKGRQDSTMSVSSRLGRLDKLVDRLLQFAKVAIEVFCFNDKYTGGMY